VKDVVWEPANKIFPGGCKVFYEDENDKFSIEPDDINQGEIGNCYFMCALSALAEPRNHKESFLVRRLFHQKEFNGKVKV